MTSATFIPSVICVDVDEESELEDEELEESELEESELEDEELEESELEESEELDEESELEEIVMKLRVVYHLFLHRILKNHQRQFQQSAHSKKWIRQITVWINSYLC